MALITLKDTTESLNVVLAGAVTTNQLEFTVNYADKTSLGVTPGSNADDTNDTSEVVGCAAPGADTQRLVDSVHVYNADTVAAIVRLIHKDSDGTDRTFRSKEISAGKSYCFCHTSSFADDVNLVVADLPDLGGFTNKTNVGSDDRVPIYDTEGSANKDVPAFAWWGVCDGRLTLTSGDPVPGSDQADKTTLYFTPYTGNQISLYDGNRWNLFTFTERSLALSSMTSDKNYDVFIYDNSGTLTLETLVWTNDTTRATALTQQDGIYVKNGDATRRHLGFFRATSATQTQDTETQRFLVNRYNKVPRILWEDAADSAGDSNTWTTGGASNWTAIGGAGTFKVELLVEDGDPVVIDARAEIYSPVAITSYRGVGIATATVTDILAAAYYYTGTQWEEVNQPLHYFRSDLGPSYRVYQLSVAAGQDVGIRYDYGGIHGETASLDPPCTNIGGWILG